MELMIVNTDRLDLETMSQAQDYSEFMSHQLYLRELGLAKIAEARK